MASKATAAAAPEETVPEEATPDVVSEPEAEPEAAPEAAPDAEPEAEPVAPEAEPEAAPEAAPDGDGSAGDSGAGAVEAVAGQCVVDDGTPHTGRAVNGLVCSAHANRYRSDGTLR